MAQQDSFLRGTFKKTTKLFVIAGLLFLLGSTALGVYLAFLSRDLPSLQQLEHYDPRLTTSILSKDGILIKELYVQRRIYTPYDRIPESLLQALLVTEDHRFYDHWGMNVLRIARAAFINITTMSIRQGASTITQQLARNLYLSMDQTIDRKAKEALTALQIERTYSKREILEMYFTQSYFGHGAYGIESAAQRYFGKNSTELTLTESALLIAQLKAPTHYSPFKRPEAAERRRNLILSLLRNSGYITDGQYAHAIQEPLGVIRQENDKGEGIAPYYSEMVRIQLEELGEELGFDYYRDGLSIYTTLDSRLQYCAEQAVRSHLDSLQVKVFNKFRRKDAPKLIKNKFPEITQKELQEYLADSLWLDSTFSDQSRVQVAFVAMDAQTGHILALIGGRDFSESKFNRAVQAIRQPGSVFKAFSYTAAIDNGYPPTYRLLNQDVVVHMPDGSRWTPPNYDGSRGGLTTLREGLKKSLNLVAVRLVQEVVKPKDVIRYAKQMGITTQLAQVDAIALGASGVIPIEITAAYGVFANRGVLCEPFAVMRIANREGDVLYEHQLNRKVALSEETAYIMTDMLRDVILDGTGGSSRWKYGFKRPAAGKTGTTNDYTDAWFVGFTPQLVAGVWVGLDDPAVSLGHGESGATAALPIWAAFMKTAYDTLN
ncbi:PBP1A family penicillin-binding protein, partial [bacterium]|nr:PBP1A family penicillin-binding protein [bacterium]